MASISVRDLDDTVAARLKVRAAEHGRSMEAEVRAILTDAVDDDQDERLNLVEVLGQRLRGAELHLPVRLDAPRAADLS